MKVSLFLIVSLVIVGCASKPKLYPNAKYKAVGPEVAKADMNECMKEADAYQCLAKKRLSSNRMELKINL